MQNGRYPLIQQLCAVPFFWWLALLVFWAKKKSETNFVLF
jgi:hypothetical protein